MSKEEQIKQAAKERYPHEGWVFQRVAFVEGARWADEHLVTQVPDNQDMFYELSYKMYERNCDTQTLKYYDYNDAVAAYKKLDDSGVYSVKLRKIIEEFIDIN
jgi:hypothetical protein